MNRDIYTTARQLAADQPIHLPPPAQPLRSRVTLTIENAPAQPEIVLRDRRRAFTWRVLMSEQAQLGRFEATVMLPDSPTLVHYHFELPDGRQILERRQSEKRRTVERKNVPIYDQMVEQEFQIAVYDPDAMPADWTQGMLIYQIFPDSFARGRDEISRPEGGPYGHPLILKEWGEPPEHPPMGRDFYGGDLRGVIDKMDYLKKLGVECIYFNPIFDAPTNHRYDANDYLDIDPMLGNNADFGDLVAAAHARGIKIVLDAVFNHCSCDSIYFDLPGKHGGAAADKESPYFRWFNFSKWPDEYQNWEGVQNMPEFVECPEVEDFFLGAGGVTAYWLIKGIDGWRTDVTDCNSDTFWRRFRERVNTLRPDAYLVSEEWEDASHYLVGDTFSATMNYRFTWAVQGFFIDQQLTAAQFEDRLATLRNDTPPPALLAQMNLLGSHDVRRILTECDEDTELLFQVVAFQMAYPGAPLVYYGDEAGLTGAYAEAGRGAFPWGNEHAGIMAFFRQVIAARNDYPALRDGDYQTLLVNDEWRLHAFARRQGEQVVVAVFNAGELTMAFDVPVEGAVDGPWRDVLGRGDEATSKDGVLKVRLPAGGMAWYVPQSTEPAKEE